jgi:hypothetical protein
MRIGAMHSGEEMPSLSFYLLMLNNPLLAGWLFFPREPRYHTLEGDLPSGVVRQSGGTRQQAFRVPSQ